MSEGTARLWLQFRDFVRRLGELQKL